MTTKLPDELRRAIELEGDSPLHLADATTNVHYEVLRADHYEKLKVVFERDEHDFEPRESYPFVDELMREDDTSDPTSMSDQAFARRVS